MSTSTRESSRHAFVGDLRSSKKRKRVGDANHNKASSENARANVNTLAAEPREQGGSMPHVPIDVDAFDDDVLVSSPTAFAQARNNSRRNRERTAIIDVESGVAEEELMVAECLSSLAREGAEERTCTVTQSSHKRRRRVPPGQTIIDCDRYICLEGPNHKSGKSVQRPQPPPPPPPPPPKEHTYSCPICMGSIDEARSTKCGHIFCQGCLTAAIAAQKKCPTCRAKITTMKSTIRVYL